MITYKEDYVGVFGGKNFVPQYAMGAPTSIQTANQLAEATARLNAGVYGVDLAPINPEIFEQIPRQHFKEIDRLMKLTGAKASIHGPIVDLAGFSQNRQDEVIRKQTEKRLGYFIDMAHELDSDGNTPINFHINTEIPGEHKHALSEEDIKELKKQTEKLYHKEDKDKIKDFIKDKEFLDYMGIINRDTGEINVLKTEIKHYPEGDVLWHPEKRLNSLNKTQWDDDKLKVLEWQAAREKRERYLKEIESAAQPLILAKERGVINDNEERLLKQNLQNIEVVGSHITELDEHIISSLNEMYNKFNEFTPSELRDAFKEKKEFQDVIDNYSKILKEERELEIQRRIAMKEADIDMLKKIEKEEEMLDLKSETSKKNFLRLMSGLPPPEIWTPTNKVAKEKTSETIANAAFESYKKYKDNTPIIAIENFRQELTLGSATDLKNVIKEARDKFSDKLVNTGMSKEKAEKEAKKLIGVTWDVGHINFLRKFGYDEKKILEETKIIAEDVKQLHITDNFGFHDAHMPPGMGNAPIDKEIQVLREKGFKFDKGNVIIEAGAFAAQFKENPHLYALEYFNSPLYTVKAMPSWYGIWETEARSGEFYGPILPERHFRDLYGAGFSNLPPELGGQSASDRGRFAESS